MLKSLRYDKISELCQFPIIQGGFNIIFNSKMDDNIKSESSVYGLLFEIPEENNTMLKIIMTFKVSLFVKIIALLQFFLRRKCLDTYYIYSSIEDPFLIYNKNEESLKYVESYLLPKKNGVVLLIFKAMKILTGFNPSISGLILSFRSIDT